MKTTDKTQCVSLGFIMQQPPKDKTFVPNYLQVLETDYISAARLRVTGSYLIFQPMICQKPVNTRHIFQRCDIRFDISAGI